MGFLYQQLRKPDEAISYHKEALSIAIQTNDIESIINIYANLGHAYKALKDLVNAKENYNKGISLSMEKNVKYVLAELYIEKSEIYIIENKKSKAKELLLKGKNIAQAINDEMYFEKAKTFLANLGGLKDED